MRIHPILLVIAVMMSGCAPSPERPVFVQKEAGHWNGYRVTWVDDNSPSRGIGFYVFTKDSEESTSKEFSNTTLMGSLDGVELYYVGDSSPSKGRGFYATKNDGRFEPMFTSGIKAGKSYRGQGQILLEK